MINVKKYLDFFVGDEVGRNETNLEGLAVKLRALNTISGVISCMSYYKQPGKVGFSIVGVTISQKSGMHF